MLLDDEISMRPVVPLLRYRFVALVVDLIVNGHGKCLRVPLLYRGFSVAV